MSSALLFITLFAQSQFPHTFTEQNALDDFAEAYNQGKLDVKKIEEIKKAWRDLESSEARFRLEKSK